MGNGPGQRMFDPKTVTHVHLGPDFYVDAQPLKIAKGDRIEVKGSRITFDGKPAIVAQEIPSIPTLILAAAFAGPSGAHRLRRRITSARPEPHFCGGNVPRSARRPRSLPCSSPKPGRTTA